MHQATFLAPELEVELQSLISVSLCSANSYHHVVETVSCSVESISL